ncbi:MAG TPA: 7-carboxy-7-deazaguanine synthase QueE [Gammaproteobacteria bacterium]|nr:7-carboxy-7-deazaguanine synthase QueE [Gammaproteobacteria bacterium]
MNPATPELAATIRITEIFLSLQGESNTTGIPTIFVRLTGCPLRCQYCDSEYAFSGGDMISVSEVMRRVADLGVTTVCVTGGEPLAQPNCHALLAALVAAGYRVSLETSGAISVAAVDSAVVKVLDIKTPGSAEVSRNLWSNMAHLQSHDQVKFVLCDRADYQWAKLQIDQYQLTNKVAEILFSPSCGELEPRELADWIVADRLPVRMQVQLHKILWGDEPGR